MLAAQHELLQKPYGTSWITYTRCHDDIGLGYEDYMIRQAGYDPIEHRKFMWNYYSGKFAGSLATGALFSVNPRTQDARISGSLASLCGLEKGLNEQNEELVLQAIRKILLMQAHSFFIGGVPMLFYGDEAGYTNDYSYLEDPGKSYDNRWMHRPVIDWVKNARIHQPGTVENRVFEGTRKLIAIRRKLKVVSDLKNLSWMYTRNNHVAGFVRTYEEQRLFCLFNFSGETCYPPWSSFRDYGHLPDRLYDHWTEQEFVPGRYFDQIIMEPYAFFLMEAM
jgi:amylosucrase